MGFFAYVFPDKLHIHKNEHNLKKYAYKYEVDFQKHEIFDKVSPFWKLQKYKKENLKHLFNFLTFMSVFSNSHFLIKRKISGKLIVY